MDKSEEQRIRDKAVADLLAKQKRALRDRMAALGRVRSPKKLKAQRRNARIAQAVRWNKPIPKD